VHQIEMGRGLPSLSTLQAIAVVLDVPLGALFEERRSAESVVLLPAAERPHARTPGGTLERLAGGITGQRLRGLILTLEPGRDTGDEPMVHSGHELIFCLAGHCIYDVAGRTLPLRPGDSLMLDSQQPHRARNRGRGTARLLIVLLADDVETGPLTHDR
jgi:quercetin dioxygenase-like cupin family protein